MRLRTVLIVLLPAFFAASALPAQQKRDDVLLADFENETYGDWKAAGEAFGPGPARGTLPGQMHVSGFRGKRLVNSFYKGDGTTGTLTSPPFLIQRRYVNFLVGGGRYPGKTCVNLLIDGETVRTATGPNDRPGGSERLHWHTWDVAEFEGKTAAIEIVDRRTGGWGHINVDQILQSDRRLQAQPASRELLVRSRFLHLPVRNKAPRRRMTFLVDGRTVREFDIELADGQPDFHVFSDLEPFQGRTLRIEVDRLPADSRGLKSIQQSDSVPGAGRLYREKHRPQFHFTSRRGWLNDPNGLVYHRGEWHLFYQHNPYGIEWGNMHWGHAVSSDLVHWRELPIALYPRRYGDWCFSGSGLIDRQNTAGFQQGEQPPLLVAYTSTARGESLAFSNDRGRSFTEFGGNPVVRHEGRDPKIIRHEPTERWVMAVYDEHRGRRTIAFYTSPDLKQWTFASRIEDFYECPDLFELAVDGDERNTRWVLYAADGRYILGRFDGRRFHRESGPHRLWHGNFYAAQTFSNAPEGRRIQIGWARGVTFPGMPFNQQMTVPVELTLRTSEDGVRMFAEPVRELQSLRGEKHVRTDLKLRPGETPLEGIDAGLLEIAAEFEIGGAKSLGLTIHGIPVLYDAAKQQLTCRHATAPLKPVKGRIRLRVLADRGSVEIFASDGRAAMSIAAIPDEKHRGIRINATGGPARLTTLTAFELNSAWRPLPDSSSRPTLPASANESEAVSDTGGVRRECCHSTSSVAGFCSFSITALANTAQTAPSTMRWSKESER